MTTPVASASGSGKRRARPSTVISASSPAAGNEVQITNHSNTKIVWSLDFTTEEAFPEIVGTFDRPEISISSAEGKAVDDETLTQKSKLNMQGALAEQVVTPTPIGEILVTLQE